MIVCVCWWGHTCTLSADESDATTSSPASDSCHGTGYDITHSYSTIYTLITHTQQWAGEEDAGSFSSAAERSSDWLLTNEIRHASKSAPHGYFSPPMSLSVMSRDCVETHLLSAATCWDINIEQHYRMIEQITEQTNQSVNEDKHKHWTTLQNERTNHWTNESMNEWKHKHWTTLQNEWTNHWNKSLNKWKLWKNWGCAICVIYDNIVIIVLTMWKLILSSMSLALQKQKHKILIALTFTVWCILIDCHKNETEKSIYGGKNPPVWIILVIFFSNISM